MNHSPFSLQPGDNLQARQRRFGELQSLCLDPDAFTLADFELWHALDEHVQRGGEVLDLRAHRTALHNVPAELMESFFDVCRLMQPALRVLQVPEDWDALDAWLDACPGSVVIARPATAPRA